METELERTARLAEVKSAFSAVNTLLFSLRDRWADEREFEDIADFGKVLAAALPPTARLVRMSKRPFGGVVEVGGAKWLFFANATTSGAKRVAA